MVETTLPHIGAIAQREARAAQREGKRGEKMKRRRIEHMGDHTIMVAMAKTEQLIVGLPIGGRESQSGEGHCHFCRPTWKSYSASPAAATSMKSLPCAGLFPFRVL